MQYIYRGGIASCWSLVATDQLLVPGCDGPVAGPWLRRTSCWSLVAADQLLVPGSADQLLPAVVANDVRRLARLTSDYTPSLARNKQEQN